MWDNENGQLECEKSYECKEGEYTFRSGAAKGICTDIVSGEPVILKESNDIKPKLKKVKIDGRIAAQSLLPLIVFDLLKVFE